MNNNAWVILNTLCDLFFRDAEFPKMIYGKDEYLEITSEITDSGVEIQLNGRNYGIRYPESVWNPLEDEIKKSILDHVSFLATNYLPLVCNKSGII